MFFFSWKALMDLFLRRVSWKIHPDQEWLTSSDFLASSWGERLRFRAGTAGNSSCHCYWRMERREITPDFVKPNLFFSRPLFNFHHQTTQFGLLGIWAPSWPLSNLLDRHSQKNSPRFHSFFPRGTRFNHFSGSHGQIECDSKWQDRRGIVKFTVKKGSNKSHFSTKFACRVLLVLVLLRSLTLFPLRFILISVRLLFPWRSFSFCSECSFCPKCGASANPLNCLETDLIGLPHLGPQFQPNGPQGVRQ